MTQHIFCSQKASLLNEFGCVYLVDLRQGRTCRIFGSCGPWLSAGYWSSSEYKILHQKLTQSDFGPNDLRQYSSYIFVPKTVAGVLSNKISYIASLRINLSLKTVQLSLAILSHFLGNNYSPVFSLNTQGCQFLQNILSNVCFFVLNSASI